MHVPYGAFFINKEFEFVYKMNHNNSVSAPLRGCNGFKKSVVKLIANYQIFSLSSVKRNPKLQSV